jgi:hypothetical protein
MMLHAQEAPKPAAPAVTVNGTLFGNYMYSNWDGVRRNNNAFSLERMYIHVRSQISDEIKFQFTSDMYHYSSDNSNLNYVVRLKYGYIDYSPMKELSIKGGMIPTVWTGYVEKFWRYRGIAKVVTDEKAYFPTADLGISASYALPEKMGEVSAFVLNGEGYTATETNKYKDLGLRASVTPFQSDDMLKGLEVGGYLYMGNTANVAGLAVKKNRFGGLVGYSYDIVSVAAEYNSKSTGVNSKPDSSVSGSALSIFGEVRSPLDGMLSKLSLVWRYDIVDPNTDNDGDKTNLLILGLAFKAADKMTLVLDTQVSGREKLNGNSQLPYYDTTFVDSYMTWYLHAIVNF